MKNVASAPTAASAGVAISGARKRGPATSASAAASAAHATTAALTMRSRAASRTGR